VIGRDLQQLRRVVEAMNFIQDDCPASKVGQERLGIIQEAPDPR
jgi:hypothetical protein